MKFSLRDLLLVTVIVALAFGWWVREVQLQNELALAKRWRNAAGTLEKMVKLEGFDVRWQMDAYYPFDLPGVEISRPNGSRWSAIEFTAEPSHDQLPREDLLRMPGMPASSAPAPNPPSD